MRSTPSLNFQDGLVTRGVSLNRWPCRTGNFRTRIREKFSKNKESASWYRDIAWRKFRAARNRCTAVQCRSRRAVRSQYVCCTSDSDRLDLAPRTERCANCVVTHRSTPACKLHVIFAL